MSIKDPTIEIDEPFPLDAPSAEERVQEPKIESSIDLIVKQIADVSKNALEQYARGEISDNDVKIKVMDQVEVAINTLVG